MRFVRMERALRMAVKSIAQHKLRAGLTVLGIIFGVSSVIAMLSVGEGVSQEVQAQLLELGSRNILISSEKPPENQMSGGASNSQTVASYGLKYDDYDSLVRFVPYLESSTPMKAVRLKVRFRDRVVETEVVATVPWYQKIKNHHVQAGRFFTQSEMDDAAPVCIIGARLARSLFATYDPLGQDLRVGNGVYRVVGVVGDDFSTPFLENRPLWFEGENESVYVPLSTYRQRNGDQVFRWGGGSATFENIELHRVVLTIEDQDYVMGAADVVRDVLQRAHPREDYKIEVPLQLIKQAEATQRLFNIVLGSIAAISLVVGGIGIMNIMLATVSERTREIGIRRALGATRRDIVVQFLVETLVLSITGGVVGLLGGVAIPKLISILTDVTTVLTPGSFIIAFVVSVAIGVVFGIYPARRAAEMDPIEALRHE